MRNFLLATAAALTIAGLATPAQAAVPKPEAITADGIPAIPDALAATTRPYMEYRTAAFQGWNAADRSMLIATRFGNVAQLHSVAGPLMDRRQISFEAEPVDGSYAPGGDVLLVVKDHGGDEFFQFYTLAQGKLMLATDGKSRNEFGAWSRDGRLIGYSSTRRNGTDGDLYIADPRRPGSTRMVAQVTGGGWQIIAFAPDAQSAIVGHYVSVTQSSLHRLDLASGMLTPIGDPARPIAFGAVKYAADGTLWVTSDEGSDVQRLGTLDPVTGVFRPVGPVARWDVEEIDVSDDGRTLAYLVNEAGSSRLMLLDTRSRRVRAVTSLPVGVASGLQFSKWGTLGLTLSSARSPADAYAVDPTTLKVTRWTASETGGLDPQRNVEPQLIEVASFDGQPVSGFLYRPDPTRFPGRRPLIVNIHGGPEGQSRPGFLGRTNYMVNELGIAVFLPNVRGSTGFGKRFVSLDNGPFKREDSVKDIGAFLTRLSADPALDAARIAVTGGSYGGYMCYASAIAYAGQLKGSLCIVAISNFVTFLKNTQSYRRDLRRVEYGNERDPAQLAKLLDISPLRRVGEIRAPLFVVTGGNDPRVPPSEANQMVSAVRAKGITAWHMLAANEGHGYAKKENQDYQFLASLMFWQLNLLK